jgi:hypothetical protein
LVLAHTGRVVVRAADNSGDLLGLNSRAYRESDLIGELAQWPGTIVTDQVYLVGWYAPSAPRRVVTCDDANWDAVVTATAQVDRPLVALFGGCSALDVHALARELDAVVRTDAVGALLIPDEGSALAGPGAPSDSADQGTLDATRATGIVSDS